MWWFINTAVSKLPPHSGKNTQASPTVPLHGHYPQCLKHWNAWSGILSPWKTHPEHSTNDWDNESANKPGSYPFTQKSKAIESWQFSLNPCTPWDHTLGKKHTVKIHNENPPQQQRENPSFIGCYAACNTFETPKRKQNFGILPEEKNAVSAPEPNT